MFVLRRIYCRVFQLAFRAALPVLPYCNPKIIPSDAGIPDVLRKHGVGSVMIVTDAGIRSLGLTAFLEKTLKENDISYCIYDRTVAIPTTAGTGSETTLAAVITDSEKHYKYPINDFSLIPRYAVLDYHETVGLPKMITATTGMDALTHAVEAYIGGSTTKETRKMAEEAVTLIHQHLKNAYDDGHNKEARKGMLKAAYCAGVAFTKSYVGYVHAVAHSLGGQYGTPHGLANAVILPVVLRMYGPACEKKLACLARKAGVVDEKLNDREASRDFIRWIQKMNDSLGIPRTISGIHEKDISMMAKHADQEGNPLYPVPVLMNRKELEQIYYKVKG